MPAYEFRVVPRLMERDCETREVGLASGSLNASDSLIGIHMPVGVDPILPMEISNLPEIVRVYTTLCR